MKKMNLNFFGLTTKIVLPLFMFIGLFILSGSSLNAQYVSSENAKELISNHLQKLPLRTASFRAKGHALTPKMVDEAINSLRHRFGQLILKNVGNGLSVGDAIDKTYQVARARIDAHGTSEMTDHLDAVKQEYVDLLTD